MTTEASNKLSQATIDLLRKVEQHILAEPRRLDMTHFGTAFSPHRTQEDSGLPPCGTNACIAGWAVVLSDPEVEIKDGFYQLANDYFDGSDLMHFEDIAAAKLELTTAQAERLFYFKEWIEGRETGNGWPEGFAMDYDEAQTAEERARTTVQRIEHFISTDGNE